MNNPAARFKPKRSILGLLIRRRVIELQSPRPFSGAACCQLTELPPYKAGPDMGDRFPRLQLSRVHFSPITGPAFVGYSCWSTSSRCGSHTGLALVTTLRKRQEGYRLRSRR